MLINNHEYSTILINNREFEIKLEKRELHLFPHSVLKICQIFLMQKLYH